MTLSDARRDLLKAALGAPTSSVRPVSGGDINHAAVVDVASRRVFVKWNDRPLPRQFEAEATGLAALRSAASSDPRSRDLWIPEPYAFNDDGAGRSFLAIEHLEAGRRRDDFDELLGRGLATIHRVTSERGYGFDLDGCCGATPQPNGFLPRWAAFYRERRLLHQARLARANGLANGDVALLERVASRLDSILPDDERPALIHGDLWSGNVIVAPDGRPALVDPAAHFADREAEFGMMRLFGGFSERTYAAYDECWPLRAGFERRLDLYRLYHVLNHFNLFGGGYGAQAVAIARRLV